MNNANHFETDDKFYYSLKYVSNSYDYPLATCFSLKPIDWHPKYRFMLLADGISFTSTYLGGLFGVSKTDISNLVNSSGGFADPEYEYQFFNHMSDALTFCESLDLIKRLGVC